MPAPTNISWPTALSLGTTLPVSTSQEQSFAGTTYETYYTTIIPAGVTEIGPFFYGNFTTWNPVMTVWRDPLGTPVQINGSISGNSVPEQALVIPGETIGFRSVKPAGNVTPALTTISVIENPGIAIATGQIFQNDISADYPGVYVSPSSGDVTNFTPAAFAYGQYGRKLTSGVSLFSDDQLNTCILYDSVQTEILQVTGLPVAGEFVIGTNQVDGFFAATRGGGATHAVAYRVSSLGIVGASYDLGAASSALQVLTASSDNLDLYFIQSTALLNLPIQKIVLGSLTITTLVAGEADKLWARGMMTMLDGTFLAGISTLSGITFTANVIRHYNPAGTLLHTYDITASWRPVYIFAALDDPDSFWVYAQPTVAFPNPIFGFNRYINIRVSDGAFLVDIEVPQFIDGVSEEVGSISSIRFGTQSGGAPMIVGVSATGTGSGLYKLTGTNVNNAVVRHDKLWVDASIGTTVDVGIPNPFAESYLVGDE